MEASIIRHYHNKSISQLIKLATKYFNNFIRQRGTSGGYFTCISCGRTQSISQLNAGHFYSAGAYAVTRFDEDNTWEQCIRCNLHLHGNLTYYRKGLEQKIGLNRLRKLDEKIAMSKHVAFHWDRFSLIEIIETYKNKQS
ncbi:recombination protein NinG [Chryseobacterium nematophagum]|uniref:recombination protein NinG n=1 Tax=Chryseobacterium nematophagum TaxID=2305228 RepID=UPI001604F1F8|nr:recombination protein NinG [Chryseobacterium nematophagum]